MCSRSNSENTGYPKPVPRFRDKGYHNAETFRAALDRIRQLKEGSVLTKKDERTLFKSFKKGNLSSRDLIVRHNLRLVAHVAQKFSRDTETFEELYAEGYHVLFHAIDKFDLEYGTKFSTYAMWWLRQAISKFLKIKNGNGLSSEIEIEDEYKDGQKIEDQERRDVIWQGLSRLTEREKDIVIRRFGLNQDSQTLEEIGVLYSLSKERIRQIEARALKKLKPFLDKKI